MPYVYDYPMQSVTADAVVLHENEVLLIKRNQEPFKGKYALPGGFLDENDEDTFETAKRELKEETGVDAENDPIVKIMGEGGIFSKKGRDPRGRVITVSYYFLLKQKPELIVDQEEVQSAEWVNISSLKEGDLAFDHQKILQNCVSKCSQRCILESPVRM